MGRASLNVSGGIKMRDHWVFIINTMNIAMATNQN